MAMSSYAGGVVGGRPGWIDRSTLAAPRGIEVGSRSRLPWPTPPGGVTGEWISGWTCQLPSEPMGTTIRRRSRPAPPTHGEWVQSSRAGGLCLIETKHAPGMSLGWHEHQRACVTYVLDGGYAERMKGRRYACVPGTVLLKPAGEGHADRYGRGGSRSFIVELPSDYVRWAFPNAALVDRIACLRGTPVTALAARAYREFVVQDDAWTLVVDGLVREMLGVAARLRPQSGRTGIPRWLEQVRERLHDEFARRLTVRDLAANAGVHPDHLSRAFRRHYGVLIGEYLRRVRLEWAAEVLASTDQSSGSIAYAAGFADQSHFTRTFKGHFGMTPGRYRSARRRD